MKTLRAFLLVMAVAAVGFVSSLALADTPADPTTDPSGAFDQFWQAVTAKRWGLAAVIGTMLFVAFVRFISPRIHGKFGAWVNTSRVSAVLAILSGGGAAVATQLMKGGHLSPKLLVYGFMIGAGAIGGYNAFFDIIFPSDKKKDAGSTADSAAALAQRKGPPAPPAAALLLPLAIGLILFSFGCPAHLTPDQRAYGNAYAACMEAKGLAVAPSVAQQAWGDLNGGATKDQIVAQLEALAGKAGTDGVTCAVQAWLAPPPSTSTTPPKLAARNPAGVEAAGAFLQKHSATTEVQTRG